ncbi:MAG: hypothetical protein ACI89D_001670 [Bermanella sp.]|jgi:hypothetical protein
MLILAMMLVPPLWLTPFIFMMKLKELKACNALEHAACAHGAQTTLDRHGAQPYDIYY